MHDEASSISTSAAKTGGEGVGTNFRGVLEMQIGVKPCGAPFLSPHTHRLLKNVKSANNSQDLDLILISVLTLTDV